MLQRIKITIAKNKVLQCFTNNGITVGNILRIVWKYCHKCCQNKGMAVGYKQLNICVNIVNNIAKHCNNCCQTKVLQYFVRCKMSASRQSRKQRALFLFVTLELICKL